MKLTSSDEGEDPMTNHCKSVLFGYVRLTWVLMKSQYFHSTETSRTQIMNTCIPWWRWIILKLPSGRIFRGMFNLVPRVLFLHSLLIPSSNRFVSGYFVVASNILLCAANRKNRQIEVHEAHIFCLVSLVTWTQGVFWLSRTFMCNHSLRS